MYTLTRTAKPKTLALSWTGDVKPGLRLDTDDEKDWVESLLVPSAVDWAEGKTNRALITQTWELKLECFPYGDAAIIIPKPPLQSITKIEYVDTAGALQEWSNTKYTVAAPEGPKARHGRVWPSYGEVYPTTRAQPEAVIITFIAGYGDKSADVPGGLREAMILVVNDRFLHRESSISGTIIQRVPQGSDYKAGMYLAEVA